MNTIADPITVLYPAVDGKMHTYRVVPQILKFGFSQFGFSEQPSSMQPQWLLEVYDPERDEVADLELLKCQFKETTDGAV